MNVRLAALLIAVLIAASAVVVVATTTEVMPADVLPGDILPAPQAQPQNTSVIAATDDVTAGDSDQTPLQMGMVEITTQKQLEDLVMVAARSGGTLEETGEVWLSAEQRAPAMSDDMMDMPTSEAMPEGGMAAPSPEPPKALGTDGLDYSGTNVQVAGVDEPDYLKTDGEYAYIGTGNMITIVDLRPASEMSIVTKVALDIDTYEIRDIFLNGDDLVVMHASHREHMTIPEFGFVPESSYKQATDVVVIDVADRSEPAIRERYSVDGWMSDARMIGGHVYLITESHIDRGDPEFPIVSDSDAMIMSRTFYFEGDHDYASFVTVAAIDLAQDTIAPRTFLMGGTGTFYMTHSNLYLTYQQWGGDGAAKLDQEDFERKRFFEAIVPLFPEDVQAAILEKYNHGASKGDPASWLEVSRIIQDYYDSISSDERNSMFEKVDQAIIDYGLENRQHHYHTIIYKISVDGDDMKLVARGAVPGGLLNQFSLGESGGGERLRVATTTEYYTAHHSGTVRSSGVYTLDEGLKIVGSVEDVAPGERIYSARFMDDRLYMVTFQLIDPFFVIDISGDRPIILGELKIPGFSDYLHPFDADHVIGIGRDTRVLDDGFVRQADLLGVKIALFDVSDVSSPTVKDQIIIGKDTSVWSASMNDHKAFFFDRNTGLASIHVEGPYEQLDDVFLASEKKDDTLHHARHWSGFYIMDIDAEDGISTRGHVSHPASGSNPSMVGFGSPRTFYVEDVLYTVASGHVVASDIKTLERLGSVKLVGTGAIVGFME